MKNYKKDLESNFIVSKIIGKDYNFINLKDMPKGGYSSANINYNGTIWVKTKDLECAKNHCGAAAATNIALYFANKGCKKLKIKNSEYDTFLELYKTIKDGPVARIANKIREYFLIKGYNLNYGTIRDYQDVKKAIKMDMPLTFLLSASLSNWHWVVAVGWREYANGDKYIQIVDGWNSNAARFYKVGSNFNYLFMTKYWIDM